MSHNFNTKYQEDINKHYRPLDRDMEKQMIIRAKCGDIKARRALVQSQLKCITGIAEKFANHKSSKEDLIGEGVRGVYTAIDKFDVSRGFRLITYSAIWAKAFISAYVHDDDTIRHPSNTNSKIKKQKAQLLNNEDPEKNLRIAMKSLDAPQGQNEDSETLMDKTSDENEEDFSIRVENKDLVAKALSHLNTRQKYVFQLMYGLPYKDVDGNIVQEDPMSLEKVGLRINRTKQSVSVIVKNAMIVLRRKMLEKNVRIPETEEEEMGESITASGSGSISVEFG